MSKKITLQCQNIFNEILCSETFVSEWQLPLNLGNGFPFFYEEWMIECHLIIILLNYVSNDVCDALKLLFRLGK